MLVDVYTSHRWQTEGNVARNLRYREAERSRVGKSDPLKDNQQTAYIQPVLRSQQLLAWLVVPIKRAFAHTHKSPCTKALSSLNVARIQTLSMRT